MQRSANKNYFGPPNMLAVSIIIEGGDKHNPQRTLDFEIDEVSESLCMLSLSGCSLFFSVIISIANINITVAPVVLTLLPSNSRFSKLLYHCFLLVQYYILHYFH